MPTWTTKEPEVVAEPVEVKVEFSIDVDICSLLVAEVDDEEEVRLADAVDSDDDEEEVDDCCDKDDVVFPRFNAA